MDSEEAAILERYKRRKERGRVYSSFDPGNLYSEWMADRGLLGLLKKHGISAIRDRKILEVGCGYDRWLRKLMNYGADPANLHGVDILEERVEGARKLHPNMHFKKCNAESLPFPGRYFDVALQALAIIKK